MKEDFEKEKQKLEDKIKKLENEIEFLKNDKNVIAEVTIADVSNYTFYKLIQLYQLSFKCGDIQGWPSQF